MLIFYESCSFCNCIHFSTQDALRLYLINSPVVHAEPLRFRKDGVYSVVSIQSPLLFFIKNWIALFLFPNFLGLISLQVKDVFLPWYNAYRFLVQNSRRLEIEGFPPFVPVDLNSLRTSNNILDKWINSSSESLVHFVRQEMDAYRLYTVCAHA